MNEGVEPSIRHDWRTRLFERAGEAGHVLPEYMVDLAIGLCDEVYELGKKDGRRLNDELHKQVTDTIDIVRKSYQRED